MKQIHNILSIAALVLAGVMTTGCVDQLNDPQQPQDGGKTVTLTTTVGLEGATKALTAGGVKTFAAGETIAVFYTNESSNLVKATYTFTADDLIDGGRRAKITVDATHPKAGGAMKYIYPASMANDDGTVNYAALATQDGTLTSLANNFDLAACDEHADAHFHGIRLRNVADEGGDRTDAGEEQPVPREPHVDPPH